LSLTLIESGGGVGLCAVSFVIIIAGSLVEIVSWVCEVNTVNFTRNALINRNHLNIMDNSSGNSSPMSRFSGSDFDIHGSGFDPTYTAEISNRMRVPKKIQISKYLNSLQTLFF